MITLTAKDKKLVFYSNGLNDNEHLFYNSVGAYFVKSLRAYVVKPSLMKFNQIKEKSHILSIDLDIDPRLLDHYKSKEESTYVVNSELNYKSKTIPEQHQIIATNMITDIKKGFIFGGVGTGKSKCVVDAISYLFDINEIKSCLYVCPASLIDNVVDEFAKHSNLHVIKSYSANQAISNFSKNENIYIVSYDILSKIESRVLRMNFDMIAFDEIHYCKDSSTIRSKSAYKIANESNTIPKYVIGFTGTEQSNSEEDIFGIFKVVCPTLFGKSITAFRERYLIKEGFRIIGRKNMEEFKRIVASVSIKFTLRDVADLPPEIETIKSSELSTEDMVTYKKALNRFLLEFEEDRYVIKNILVKILKLSQLSSGFMEFLEDKEGKNRKIVDVHSKKLDLLKDILQERKEKITIVCRFSYSIKKISELCEQLGIKYYVFDGKTKDRLIYKVFNEDNENSILITQIQKSIGYSVPNCKLMVFYELSYSKMQKDQAKGRILRLKGSEKGSCEYIYLQIKNTIDIEISQVLKTKDFTANDAVSYVKRITKKEG